MTAELRWAEEAAADLENITNYLFETTPARAADLVRGIYNASTGLLMFPNRGRTGRKEGPANLYFRCFPGS
jgi:plasmid stabilization system protein ParE